MTHLHLEDDLFHLLPLPGLRWPAHAPTHAQPNPAYQRTYHPGALPAPVTTWADGTHQTRLLTHTGERRVCRLNLRSLPNGDRILLIEDVHSYHLDPVTHLPDRDALLHDAAQTHGVTTLATLRLPPARPPPPAGRRARRSGPAPRRTRTENRRARLERQRVPHRHARLHPPEPQPLTPDQLAPVTRRIHAHLSALGRTAEPRVGLSDAPHDGRTLADLLTAAQDRAGTHPTRRPWTA